MIKMKTLKEFERQWNENIKKAKKVYIYDMDRTMVVTNKYEVIRYDREIIIMLYLNNEIVGSAYLRYIDAIGN